MRGVMNLRRKVCGVGLAVAMTASACATGERPPADRVAGALTQVMTAEAEQMRGDGRAHALRLQARRTYQEATAAMNRGQHRKAALLLEQSEADAALSVALAREEQWTFQAQEVERALAASGSVQGGRR
jgi:hypothetical protein